MREFLKSKKVKAYLVALLAEMLIPIAMALGFPMEPEHAMSLAGSIVLLTGSYIHSQGGVDKVKEAANGGNDAT